MLQVVEVFGTIQGEGPLAGTPAVFIRLAGCNLWNGLPEGRAESKGECGTWCDTYFAKGTPMDGPGLVEAVRREATGEKLIVLTGGEPLLQLRTHEGVETMRMLKAMGFLLSIESNGTIDPGPQVRMLAPTITVSPKPLRWNPSSLDHVKCRVGHTLKVVTPHPFGRPALERLANGFQHLCFQPRDDGNGPLEHLDAARADALEMGGRISLQTHKLMGVP